MSLEAIVKSSYFEKFILTIIAINSITLGIETAPQLSSNFLNILEFLDKIFLSIFVIELLMKFFVYKTKFFHEPWRIFDFSVVVIALFPASGAFSVVRSLRVLRALRMLSVIPSLRRVINGLLIAIPGLGAVTGIMLLVFYVGSVMATKLFGPEFPQWFGSIWKSAYSLFQIMTLESWSMGIVRPVMEVFPYSWLFFLPFILITTFTTLNLFIAVMCNAMQSETDDAAAARAEKGHDERKQVLDELALIKSQLSQLEKKY